MQKDCPQPGKLSFWIPLAFAAAGLAVYWPSFSAPFIFDDINLILNNPHIRDLWPLWRPVYTIRPLVDITLAINYALGGYEVAGYHAFNLAVHLAASLALLGIVRRSLMISLKEGVSESSATWIAALTAFLWMCHPLQTESVTYVIHRSESMMGLFYLLTLYAFIRGASQVDPGPWFKVSIACCAAGMATKSIMLTAPLAVWLWDRYFISGSFAASFKSRRGYYTFLFSTWLLLAVCASLPVMFNWHSPWLLKNAAVVHTPPLKYFIAQCTVLIDYTRLCFWPYPVSIDYFWSYSARYESLFSCAVILLVLAGIGWGLRKYPRAAFLGVMFFLILMPTSSFFPLRDLQADRRLYLSLAPLTTAVVLAAHALVMRAVRYKRLIKSLALLLIASIALIFCVMTFQRNMLYRNPDALWREALKVNPSNWRAINNIARNLLGQRSYREAADVLKTAIKENPSCVRVSLPGQEETELSYPWPKENREDFTADSIGAETYNLAGMCSMALGETGRAVHYFVCAVKLEPWQANNFINLGSAMANQGNLRDAATYFKIALEVDPESSSAVENLAELGKLEAEAEKK